jgi:S1-C subfamily serine protease
VTEEALNDREHAALGESATRLPRRLDSLGDDKLLDWFRSFVIAVRDPESPVTSTGFFVSPNGHLLTCWHVVEGVDDYGRNFKRDWMWAHYQGTSYRANVLWPLSNQQKDIAVLRIDPADMNRLQGQVSGSAPMRFPWGESRPGYPTRLMGGPVIACGYQRQDKFEGLLLVRGQTPAGPPRQVRALDGGIQECIPFIALGVHTDLGISGAPLLNPLTGYVEGIVAGVDTNEAESKLGLQPQVQAFSAPLDDVQLRWPEFGKECGVRPYSPTEDIVEQGEEFFRHGAPSRLTARPLWTKHVDEFLNDPERRSGYLLLLAGPGSGKSSFTVQYATSASVSPLCYFLRDGDEPPRDCRRPNSLRGWDHGKTEQVLPRSAGTSGEDGVRERA